MVIKLPKIDKKPKIEGKKVDGKATLVRGSSRRAVSKTIVVSDDEEGEDEMGKSSIRFRVCR